MSSVLKGEILGAGALESKIYAVLTSLANLSSANNESAGNTPVDAQRILAQRLADAISDGVAKGVQQYLLKTVLTIPAPGPVNHFHKLQAP
jgi:K+-transporting ATPase A subunit